jgi:hypothetical protein
MDTDAWIKVRDAFVSLGNLDDALGFAVTIAWLVGWYILYHMVRLSFLKWIIAGDILYVVLWLFDHHERFIGYPAYPYGIELSTVLFAVGNAISLAANALCAIGLCLAIRHLQKEWAEQECRQRPGSAQP